MCTRREPQGTICGNEPSRGRVSLSTLVGYLGPEDLILATLCSYCGVCTLYTEAQCSCDGVHSSLAGHPHPNAPPPAGP